MDQRERVGDPEEALLSALEGAQAKVWTALPGIVAAVDLNAQTVSVQPTIRGRVTGKDGRVQSVNMPLLVDVPLVFPRAGGFALTLPVAVGDEVLAVFASRAIDSWWQSGGIGEPVEARMHDLSDAFAIPGPTSQPKKLVGVSASSAQLRNESGDTFLEVAPNGAISIIATTEITMTAPQINLNGAVAAANGMAVTGNMTSTGSVTATGDVIGAGTSLHTHVHGGVQPGGANTGVPV